MAVSFGPTQSSTGPTNTGPKFSANTPMFHRTASLLSCQEQRLPSAASPASAALGNRD